ncbi:Tobamovirus multiplication protein 2A [Capsicum annuum]|uniref:Tobamovirus multiplication protein 2A n=1 Tax=Capsicum annuum TaxID=4072 RepID=A0A2G3AFG9_CAPAN|nr:tobamovirus multiplication protein 2A [Capsicum annuum]XP_047250377.1 tobamovirus multiplication protein 2A [Capsicum annuum]XP_047250380.1 tobamovirus multiplication protein 2A [Capsicum annuum]PHT92928.1 Tobamovirus multiplication protein 2A [Capsicum annuum]
MACKGFWECLLKLLNFLLTLVGLAMVGYGIYLFVEYKNHSSSGDDHPVAPPTSAADVIEFGRPMLMAVSLADNIFDKLPKPWFIFLFIGVGAVLVIVSCCGCIGAATRNGCCLSCYSVLIFLLILVELGAAGFMFFDKSWREEIPTDKTGNFDTIYGFLDEHWKIVKWVALGAVILEALIFLLALIVRAANRPADYDSDDEYIGGPRQQIRQPLISNRAPPNAATGVPVTGTLDNRPSRNDAWSTRMREKYGLDTSEFTYNPSESNRYPQTAVQPQEEKKGCAIM